MEFFHKVTRFPFMHTRKVWYGLSAILIIASFGLVLVRGLNLGVDFTGGVVVETNFPPERRIRSTRCGHGAGHRRRGRRAGAGVRQFAGYFGALAAGSQCPGRADRCAHSGNLLEDRQRREAAANRGGGSSGGAGTVRQRCAWALFATLVLILIYVLFRFTPKLALGAIFAVLHDPICVVGFFALTQMTFDLTAISAVLAVIGYSLNDTVIVLPTVSASAPASLAGSPIAQVIE